MSDHQEQPEGDDDRHEPIPSDRLQAVDLRNLSPERMKALKSEALRRRVTLQILLSQIVEETSRQILASDQPKHA